jgi:hypothetical protein
MTPTASIAWDLAAACPVSGGRLCRFARSLTPDVLQRPSNTRFTQGRTRICGDYLHDGATAGFSSFAFFNPKEDFGAVVFVNTGPETQPFATLVGVHIRQRFTGAPAISLAARN